jgi:outer membrane protein TolC
LTLQEAVVRAFVHAPSARIARLETARAEDDLSMAESSYWPFVGMSSAAGWSNRMDETLEAVDGKGRVREYPLSSLGSQDGWINVFVKQLLFDLAEWHLIERSEIEAEAARISEAREREAIALDVLVRYAEVLRLGRLIEVENQAVKDGEWLDGQAQILLEAGRCLPGQREEVGVHLERARLDAALRQAERASGKEALTLAIGDPNLASDSLDLDQQSLPSPTEWPGEARAASCVTNSPAVRVLEARIRAEKARVAAARAGRYPTVDLVAGYSHYGIKRYDSYEDEVHGGIDFEMPLFDGFRTKHAVSRALHELEIARLRYQSMVDAKRVAVRDLARRLAAAQRRIELVRQQERVSADRLKMADLNLQAQRSNLDAALAARAERTRDARAAVEAEHEGTRLWATLQREIGMLAGTIVGDRDAAGAEAAP